MEKAATLVDPLDIPALLHDIAQALRTWDLDTVPASVLHDQLVATSLGLEQIQAGLAAVTQRWEASGVWSADGSKSPAARLARDTGTSRSNCSRKLGTARAVAQMPVAGQAWLDGEISADSISLLTRARGGGRAELFRRDEELLVGFCRDLRHSEAARAIRYWIQRANGELSRDGAEPKDRHLSLDPTFDGAISINGVLDPVGGAEVQEALRRIERDLYRDDERTGTKRTYSERLADALVEMARRAMATPANARRPQPLVTIVVGEDSMRHLLELSNGQIVDPVDVVASLGDSMVQSFLYDGMIPLAATAQRTFTGRLRRAIQVRDRRCQHPSGCDEPVTRCDVDHIVPVAEGQPTAPWNGRLLCEVHNRDHRLRNRSPDVPDNVFFLPRDYDGAFWHRRRTG